MAKLFDLVKVNTATTGTGTITFGSVTSAEFFTPAESGVVDGDTVRYVILDGTNIEEGLGVIGSSVTTMTRTVTRSRIAGVAGTTKLTLSGTAIVALTASTDDILQFDRAMTLTSTQKTMGRSNVEASGRYGKQVFTTSGTFTTPSDSTTATFYRYRLQGGGGGGGGSNAAGGCAGGGGAGAFAEGTFTGVAPSTGITITIGSNGSGGGPGLTGGAGGNSSIGSPVSITAGGGGPGVGTSASVSLGGSGGTITGSPNMLTMPGARGDAGLTTTGGTPTVGGGDGADSYLGTGGMGGHNNVSTSADSAVGYGAGGGGAFHASGTGGNGTSGVLVIEWVL